MLHRRHLITYLLISASVLAYDAVPRWGQATVLVNDAMFVFGGKTDEFNAYSYTSAPDTNDILYLSLSSPFNTNSPPWELVSSAENNTSKGPSLSWHTLSALNSTHALLFGGLPGPNAVTPVPESSGLILSVLNRLQPVWLDKSNIWAGEPIRRMRHTAVTSMSGRIFIIGGERTDGSGLGFGDHFVFDPLTQMFSPLPTVNSPPALFGHASIILPDGRLLVFGGYSQAEAALVPLSTIWVLNTSSNPLSWSMATTGTGPVPSPRMSFAAAHIGGGRIVVHGGADASLQTNFDDGWILDTSRTPMSWTQRPGLAQIGARRDHFAVAYSNRVLFGFGYGNNGPAPAPLVLYDADSDSISPSYTPPPVASIPDPTLPPLSGSTYTMRPTPTTGGNSPSNTNDPGGNNDDKKSGGGVAVILGAILGVLGAISVSAGLVYYVRRRQSDRGRFVSILGDDDDAGSDQFRAIPALTMREGYERRSVLGSLGGVVGAAATRMRSTRQPNVLERRDMLADEDARSFGEWYRVQESDVAGSSWSLRSILGGGTGAAHRLASREPSFGSRGTASKTTPWAEKDDPFSDGARAIHDEETGFIGAAVASRPSTRRETSHASSVSAYSQTSYRDPFSDPIREESDDVATTPMSYNQPSVRQVTSLPPMVTILPLSHQAGHTLSPVSERTSRTTLAADFNTISSSHANSSENAPISPFDGGSISQATSITSVEPGYLSRSSSSPSAASILASQPVQPMKRSDSWWSRFASGHLLERHSSVKSQTQHDPRDIHPPVRLGAIEERSIISTAPNSGDSGQDSAGLPSSGRASPMVPPVPYRPSHGKSLTSLRTADSETIERIAGTMDVVQRFKTQSHEASGSFSSAGSVNLGGRSSQLSSEQDISETGELLCTSPLEMESPIHAPLSAAYFSSPDRSAIPKSPVAGLPPVSPGSNVAARIQSYERRLSQDRPQSPPGKKKRPTVEYGFVSRPSLFVANPDRRPSGSSSVDSKN